MKWRTLKLGIFGVLLAGSLEAQIPVNLYKLGQGLTDSETYTVFNLCKNKWNKTFKHHKIYLNSWHADKIRGCALNVKQYDCFWNFILSRYSISTTSINVFVLPNLIDGDNRRYFGGYAGFKTFGTPYSMAVVFVSGTGNAGQSRVETSATIVCHEIGHVVGATHSSGIMSKEVKDGSNWSKKSKREIRESL